MKSKIILSFFLLLFIFITFQLAAANQDNYLYLEQAIESALRNNNMIFAGIHDQEIAEINLEMARKAFYPEIDISTSYTRMFFEEQELVGIPPGFGELIEQMSPNKNNYQSSISLQQPIYLGGRLRRGLEQAAKGLTIAELQLEQKKSDLILQVIEVYYNVLLAQKRVSIEKEVLELIKEHKRVAEHSYKAGVTLKTDLLQVEIEQSRAENSLEVAQNNLVIAGRYLENILGLELGEKDLKWPEIEFAIINDLENEYQQALAKRIELELLAINKELLEMNLQMEKNSRLPSIVLSGNYQWQGEELSFNDGVGSITLAGSFPLFDKGLSKHRQEKIEQDIAKLNLNKNDFKEHLKIEIEELLLRMRANKNSLKTEKINLKRAEENLEIENKRYQTNIGTNREVLEAQTVLNQSKIAILQAEYQYNINVFNFLNKTGQLLNYWQNKERWN